MSVRFDASGDKLTRTANLPGDMRGVTLCGWFRLITDTNNYACPLNISNTTSVYAYLETTTDGVSLKVWHPAASATMLTLVANTWYFLALTVGASTGTVTGYYAALGTNTLTAASPTGTIGIGQVPDLDRLWRFVLHGRALRR